MYVQSYQEGGNLENNAEILWGKYCEVWKGLGNLINNFKAVCPILRDLVHL